MKIKKIFELNKFVIKIALIFLIIFGSIQITGCTSNPADREDQRTIDCIKRALKDGTDTSVCDPDYNPMGIVWMGNSYFENLDIFANASIYIKKP